jgi:hypothetical protein
MTEQQDHRSEPEPRLDPTVDPASPEASDEHRPTERKPAIGETVGTGTSIALGCVAATVLLVLIGVVFLVVVMVLG